MSVARKQAPRIARPAARYWKGKAPKGVAVDSDSDAEDHISQEEDGDVPISGEQNLAEEDEEETTSVHMVATVAKSVKSMNVSLKDVSISKDGKVIVAGREESGRTVMEADESEGDDESEEEQKPRVQDRPEHKAEADESSESESGSEEEDEDDKPQLQFRPVYIPKRSRVTIVEREAIAHDTEEALKKKELEAEERRKQSHDLVAESIKRELAEKEKEEMVPDVDDTDGLDPAAEFEAWRLRELGRIKKGKEEEVRREEEREEIERRRAMPEEQRLKEDLEKAKKSREEKPKGQQKFLQKYWHKGAFRQDDEILKKHDYTEATESVVDVSMLPKVMQVKDFGKRSRTKYTHLLDQDTTVPTGGFGGAAPIKAGGKSYDGSSGCFSCGGPHLKKDCPQNIGPVPPKTNSNATPIAPRNWGNNHESSSWRHHDESYDHDARGKDLGRRAERRDEFPRDRGDWNRDRSRERFADDRRRPNARPRSPPRELYLDYGEERRERRRSRSADRNYRDKRRRLD